MTSNSKSKDRHKLDEKDDYFSRNIEELGLMSLQIYQRQQQMLDRLWQHFYQYSCLLLILSILMLVFKDQLAINKLSSLFAMMPAAAYLFFYMKNHYDLSLILHELQQFKAVAISQTRLQLKSFPTGRALLIQLVFAYISLIVYTTSWYYVYFFIVK